MSTFETDEYWRAQQNIVESFVTMTKAMKAPALHKALQGICTSPDVHERTKEQCRAIYNTYMDQFDERADVSSEEDEDEDANNQYQQHVLDKEADEADYAEMRNAPSEGFDRP